MDLSLVEEMATKRTLPQMLGGREPQEPYAVRTIRAAWQENGYSLEGSKLSLVGTSITTIGDLPSSVASQVQTLYLSNNNISSLGGIDQIKGLRSLSMANNLVRYLGQLEILGDMEVLEKLSLEGNPVSNMPFYRACVLHLCPNLGLLDGKKVTIEDRKLVSGHVGKINQYFDTLRKNELRNVVLQHLAGTMSCNSELFEFLKASSSDRNAEVHYAHQNVSHSTATAFRILLIGGVYKWLQATGADNFDCVVQSLAASLHVQMMQEYSASEKVSMQSSPDSLYKHWKSVVEGCIGYQEDLAVRLIGSCQVQKGGTGSQESDSVPDIMQVLLKLNFEKLSGDREYDTLYRGDPARAKKGPLEKNLTQSMADRYQRILIQSAMPEEDVDKGLDTSTQSASLAHSLPPQQSEPESPIVKAFDPGLQSEPGVASHWTEEITSPVRHTRTDKDRRSRQLGSPSRAGKTALSTLESKLDFSDERVVRFLNRSLLHDNDRASVDEAVVLGRDIVGEWLHAYASAKAMVKLDSDVGLEVRLGPSPHLESRGAQQAKSMPELKSHVHDALTDLTISQRESYMCWSIFEALQKQAAKVRTVMGVAEEKVHSKLDLYFDIIKVLNDDVNSGTQWVSSVQSLLAEVDKGRRLLFHLKESIEQADDSRQKLVALKESESAKKASLLSSVHEANMAISSMSTQMYKNPSTGQKKKISKARSILDRVEDMESRSFLLLARVFRHFRRSVVHQRHVKASMRHMRVRRLKRVKRSLFFRWTMLLQGSYRRRMVTLRAESALIRTTFGQWIVAFHSEYKVRRYLSRKNERAQRHFFRQLESLHSRSVKASKSEKKQDVVVTCFTMVRQFRAWKGYYEKSKLPLNVEAEHNLRAAAHFKRSLFLAWWQLCLEAEAEQKLVRGQFVESSAARVQARCFRDWSCQFRARNLLRYKLCIKGLVHLHISVRRSRRAKQFLGWAVEFNSQSQLYTHRHEAFLALYFAGHRRKRIRVAAEKVTYRKKRRMVLAAWSVMSTHFNRNIHLGDIFSTIVRRGSARRLKDGFQRWTKLSTRPTLESLAAAAYFDDETFDDASRLEIVNSKRVAAETILIASDNDNTEEASSQENLVRYRGILLTREQVEMARLERMVDEDFCLLGSRYYTRNVLKYALEAWSKCVSKRGTMKVSFEIVKRKSCHRSKRRVLIHMMTSWLSNIAAARLELSKDIGIAALDSERSSLLLECSNYRTQILRQQERSHYLNEKLLQVSSSAETARKNLEDTSASLAALKVERDTTQEQISRLRDESQTITIMAEGLSAPSSVRDEVDRELEAMLGTEGALRSRNAELLVSVESNYKRAVSIEVEAKKEQSKIKAEVSAVHDVTSLQEKEFARVEEQVRQLVAEKEEVEKHISNATKSFDTALHDIKKRKESIEKQIVEVDLRKDDAHDRFMRAQKEEKELRIRVDELRTSKLAESNTDLSRPGDQPPGEASVLSSLDHVTESRALLESALLEVAELSRREELLSGDIFSRNMAEMEDKRLNSFLVPEEQDDDETEESSVLSHSFQQMAASLDKINMNALELLDENRSVGRGKNPSSSESSASGARGGTHKKRPSVPSVPTRRAASGSRPGTVSAAAPAPHSRRHDTPICPPTGGAPRRASTVRKKSEKTLKKASDSAAVAEPTTEEISQEISNISDRLRERLNKEWF